MGSKIQEQMEVKLLQPWSTFVLATTLPPLIFDKMIRITDEIVENRESATQHGHKLAGQIEDEFTIDLEILDREELLGFFLDVTKNFITQAWIQRFGGNDAAQKDVLSEEFLTQLVSMWMVSQKDNEYNPMHVHGDCHISAVMYLKIPEYLPTRKSNKLISQYDDESFSFIDGSIMFTNNKSTDNIWADSTLQIQPQPGDLFIFPATQQHQVYPFRTADGKGERRSVSFNASFTTKREQEYLERQRKDQSYRENFVIGSGSIYSVGSSENI